VSELEGNSQPVYRLLDSHIFKFDFTCRLCGICLILRQETERYKVNIELNHTKNNLFEATIVANLIEKRII